VMYHPINENFAARQTFGASGHLGYCIGRARDTGKNDGVE